MKKIGKKSMWMIVATITFLFILTCFSFQSTKSDIAERVKEERTEYPQTSAGTEDTDAFEKGSLIGIHIGLGEVLGKAALNNGGLPLHVNERKERSQQLKRLDIYPEEMKKAIELISEAAFQKNSK